jgi:hypothetical protein
MKSSIPIVNTLERVEIPYNEEESVFQINFDLNLNS